MNTKNFSALSAICAAAICIQLSGCSTSQTSNNNSNGENSPQVTNTTGTQVSDHEFSSDGAVNTASTDSANEDSKSNSDEMGTRVRHKKSKRGIASVDEQ